MDTLNYSNATNRNEHAFQLLFVSLESIMPTIVTAHTFCASRDTRISCGLCLLIYRDIFARFKTMGRKNNLASFLGIQKENGGGGGGGGGNHAFFRDN